MQSKTIALTAAFAVTFVTPVFAQEGWGQITMQNNTDATADLYVGGAYGCRALRNLVCTTQIRVGTHDLEAKLTDGLSVSERGVVVQRGEVRTWTIRNVWK